MPEKTSKIFVLDTSVILYDHNSLNAFTDNDIAIPISVLEELDNFKKGNENKNFEAREFIRLIDTYSKGHSLTNWRPISGSKKGKFKVVMHENSQPDATKIFGEDKADHRILNAAIRLKSEHPKRTVILVTKDINLRLKAKALDVPAQDFEFGKIQDVKALYKGKDTETGIDSDIINQLYKTDFIPFKAIYKKPPIANHYFILKNGKTSALAYFNPATENIERVEKRNAYNIKPRNAEQVFAFHALLNPEIKLVTIQGVAGTGKTLLALAAALAQRRDFRQIYLARPIVPLSNKDIGYLPGDIKSKLNPYMAPIYDNFKYIQNTFGAKDKEAKKIIEMLEDEKILITPLAYIRGRSLSNIFFIIDEAQNLTPHEIKTIITRAGENSKIIFTGDIFQIDTPYLDTQSNGLSYLIDKIHKHSIHAHITLEKGERSDLANLANELL